MPIHISRRTFLGGVAIAGAAAAGISAVQDDTENLESVRVDIALPHLPAEFRGYRIAVLTDLHLGVWVRDDLIDQAISDALAFHPDLVLLGGDYIWVPEQDSDFSTGLIRNHALAGMEGSAAADMAFARISRLLERIEATDGCLAVVGNHDLWMDQRSCIRHLTRLPRMRLLVNQGWSVRRGETELSVWGTDDYLTGAPRLPDRKWEKNQVHLLLTHNPDLAARAMRRSTYSFDLAICGHTHGGQIHLPIIGAVTYHLENPEFGEGLIWRGEQAVYVSRGIGVVEVPYRVLCRPEVSLVTLV